MEVAVLSGHICNWGLSLLYAKREVNYWGRWTGWHRLRELEARGTTGKLSAPAGHV